MSCWQYDCNGSRHNPSSMPVNYMNAPVASSILLPKTDFCFPHMDLVNGKTNRSILFDETLASEAKILLTSKMVSKDANKQFFREKSGISFADVSPNAFKEALDSLDSVMAEEQPLESFDHGNLNVELPCWKGTLASYDSPLQPYVPLPVSKVFPMKFSDVVKLPPRKPVEIKMTDEPVSILSPGEDQLDAKAGSYHEKTVSGKEAVSGCSASLLIDAMLNLSKFLLNHCSNGTFVLSEQEVSSLEEVICNFDKCISTNIGQELHSDLRLGINMGCLQVEATAAPSQKGKQSDEKDESFPSPEPDTQVTMDKKAQEAALCFHHLNTEMEKTLSDSGTDAEANDSPISGKDKLGSDADGTAESPGPGMTSEEDGVTASWDDDWEHVSMEELSELNTSS